MKSTHPKSEKETPDLVQSLVSRLEKLEGKVAELGVLIEKLTRKTPAASVSAAARVSPGITPQLLAVIIAAIDTVIKEPHLIQSIREVNPEEARFQSLNWSIEGRRQIFSSHRVR